MQSNEPQRPLASLSLDLDNVWSYMKTHGDQGWEDFPSYLDQVAELALERLHRHGLTITVFVVGQDAALAKNAEALGRFAKAGHEIGNHSFSHEPWFHEYSPEKVDQEIGLAEEHIERVTGRRPRGYRAPGFSLTPEALRVLACRSYLYDASTFPTFLGPLARAYYFFQSRNLSTSEQQQRRQLFGSAREGLRDIRPYLWRLEGQARLLEIPVTTMPVVRFPFHLSYLLYLAGHSVTAAMTYLQAAIQLCRLRHVVPSFLLHPLDFLGGDREGRLGFFPAMQMSTEQKLTMFDRVISTLQQYFHVVNMETHAKDLLASGTLELKDAT